MLKDLQEKYLERICRLLRDENVKNVCNDDLTWFEAERLLYEHDIMHDYPTLEDMFYCVADNRITEEEKERILKDHFEEAFC